jgi:hypothetical protein
MTTTTAIPAPEQADLEAFLGRFVGDLGSALAGVNIVVGDRLGLYAAVADHQPATASDVATATGTDERYVTEWLRGQAAGGYLEYDPSGDTYSLTPAQAACLADADSPTYVPGAFQIAASIYKDSGTARGRVPQRRRHRLARTSHHDLFEGTERFFRPGYVANLVSG